MFPVQVVVLAPRLARMYPSASRFTIGRITKIHPKPKLGKLSRMPELLAMRVLVLILIRSCTTKLRGDSDTNSYQC